MATGCAEEGHALGRALLQQVLLSALSSSVLATGLSDDFVPCAVAGDGDAYGSVEPHGEFFLEASESVHLERYEATSYLGGLRAFPREGARMWALALVNARQKAWWCCGSPGQRVLTDSSSWPTASPPTVSALGRGMGSGMFNPATLASCWA